MRADSSLVLGDVAMSTFITFFDKANQQIGIYNGKQVMHNALSDWLLVGVICL